MLNRISSFHNYQAVQNDISRQEAKVHHTSAQLASGKKLLTAGDDPVAALYAQNLTQKKEELRQYTDTITLARNRLERHEVAIANAEQFADDAKRSVMEMINGSLAPEDRYAHAQDLKGIASNFLNLTNMLDESGNYLFSGTKPKTQPFFKSNDGTVAYAGDEYQRKLKVSGSIEVAVNDAGSKLFTEIKNPFGDYDPQYALQEGSELLLSQATNTNYTDPATYEVSFSASANGQYNYQLSKDGSVVKNAQFDPSEGIKYEGVDIQIRGQLKSGDVITLEPKKTISIFDSFKKASELALNDVADASTTAELQQVTDEFHAAFIHLSQARAEVGTRQNTLDQQEQQHQDFDLTLSKSLSSIEDLDYAQAVIEFNENTRALQASQQAFGKVKDITLFNYV
ncbi:flagellar hook-associated protein FlgL [Aliivibrio fischeri]|uniref:Flagellar hook-associated protein 3 n=1 Tax=Aliivibrio fischeri (strain MJ11) TaxID=388396 RepID=B5FGS1_ALIFM|nr:MULTISPECIES: flagellar hook-associated protein FlgL [Aliivibrio]ACH66642.1 flagellar hook-associated protein 3 [Aliivibrio fischeri MJ11]MBD1568888.1 flagellar hook-associated protein FlgL [Aliivibrio sp. S10_S31]MCE4934923.1 flagellar hook-associated protein FlgL [Aliivibrio fischeri]MUK61001.1 flagellar hook-associated protein FlgL [Aliivibrio fischeri]MUK76118.1 flagellar hook-associated protein FlgL [Aliivibrio fischeri]